jgi:hypothetical protein
VRKHRPSRIAGVGRGADHPTLEATLVTKSEEAIAGYFNWQKLLREARDHAGLPSNDDDGFNKNDFQ